MVATLKTEGVPTYLVAFRERSEANIGVLSKLIGDKTPSETNGIMHFAPGRGKKASALYSSRLAVAEMDMTEAEADEMRAMPDVMAVERNEIMSIPRPVAVEPQRAVPTGTTGLSPEMTGYLRGVRDLADMMLGTAGARLELPTLTHPTPVATAQTWGLNAIGVTDCGLTGTGVKMAVLDTGLDLTHADFTNVKPENTASFVGTETAQDGHGHGTHCCGTAVGTMTPASGPRYSVAPGAELLVGKVLADDGRGFTSQIIDGITWAVDQGAKIISMSLGSPRMPDGSFSRVYEMVFERILADGVLVVCAAGNESSRPFQIAPVGNPAACPTAMSVAAVDERMAVAPFSCGQVDEIGLLDIAAPGVDVLSAWTGGGYRSIQGTSMATPHVSGLAALYLEQDPSLSPGDLRDLMKARARPLGPVRDFGAGLARVPADPSQKIG